jgi:hypothetical protein
LETVDPEYPSALVAAAAKEHLEVVRLLIEKGAESDSELQTASEKNRETVVRLLAQGGADVNKRSGKYGSPLQRASYFGHLAVVRALVHNGANVNIDGGEYGSPLQAASTGRQQLIDAYHTSISEHQISLEELRLASKGYVTFVKLLCQRHVQLDHRVVKRVVEFETIHRMLVKNGAVVPADNQPKNPSGTHQDTHSSSSSRGPQRHHRQRRRILIR